jgi:hypothetical protein
VQHFKKANANYLASSVWQALTLNIVKRVEVETLSWHNGVLLIGIRAVRVLLVCK